MSYEAFLDSLLKELRARLGAGYHLRVDHLIHNNDTPRDALTILQDGQNISPAIHLDWYYQKYRLGIDMDEICRYLLSCYESSSFDPGIDLDFLKSWDNVRERLVCRLVGRERNTKRLEDLVYTPFLDMAVIYYYMFPEQDGIAAGVALRRAMIQKWGVGLEEIDQTAVENTREYYPPRFAGMDQIMNELMQLDTDSENGSSPLYVLTNRQKMNGAYWMRDANVMEMIREEIGDGFLVLPSSIHECLILPEGITSAEELGKMVREINRTQVDAEEVLTDSVYRYRKATGLAQVDADQTV